MRFCFLSAVRASVVCGCLWLCSMGCTTVGFHSPAVRDALDYGPNRVLRLCFFKDRGLPDADLTRIVEAWHTELAPFGISLRTERVTPYDRTDFGCIGLGNELRRLDLEPPCDRVMIILKRTPLDLVWGLLLPTVFGAVDSQTGTRGYAFGDLYLVENILFFRGDASVLIHEGYHLFGCGHSLLLEECYRTIARLKRAFSRESGFFPARSEAGTILLTREEANRLFFGDKSQKQAPEQKRVAEPEAAPAQGGP